MACRAICWFKIQIGNWKLFCIYQQQIWIGEENLLIRLQNMCRFVVVFCCGDCYSTFNLYEAWNKSFQQSHGNGKMLRELTKEIEEQVKRMEKPQSKLRKKPTKAEQKSCNEWMQKERRKTRPRTKKNVHSNVNKYQKRNIQRKHHVWMCGLCTKTRIDYRKNNNKNNEVCIWMRRSLKAGILK